MNQKLVVNAVSNGAFGEVIDDGTGGLLAAIARSIWAIPGSMGRHDNATFSPSLAVLQRGEERVCAAPAVGETAGSAGGAPPEGDNIK